MNDIIYFIAGGICAAIIIYGTRILHYYMHLA